jgi:hypothetical protein
MSFEFTRGSEVKLLTLQGFRRGVVTDKGYLRNRPGVLMYRIKFDEYEHILPVDANNKNLMSASVSSDQYLFDLFISEPPCPLGPIEPSNTNIAPMEKDGIAMTKQQ